MDAFSVDEENFVYWAATILNPFAKHACLSYKETLESFEMEQKTKNSGRKGTNEQMKPSNSPTLQGFKRKADESLPSPANRRHKNHISLTPSYSVTQSALQEGPLRRTVGVNRGPHAPPVITVSVKQALEWSRLQDQNDRSVHLAIQHVNQ